MSSDTNANAKPVGATENPDGSKVLDLNDILELDAVEYKLVPGFKPNTSFRLRSLLASDFMEWQEANEGEAKRTAGLRLIIRSVVDKDGKILMDDSHIAVLRRKTVKITEGLVREIVKFNGLSVKGETTKND